MKLLLTIILLFVLSCKIEEVRPENKISNVAVVFAKQDENSFVIKKTLEDMFDLSGEPRYKILASKKEEITTSGFGSDAFTSNFLLTITVSFKLVDAQSGKVLLSGKEIASANYISSRQNIVAEVTSKNAAGKHVAENVAGKIYNFVQAHFNLESFTDGMEDNLEKNAP